MERLGERGQWTAYSGGSGNGRKWIDVFYLGAVRAYLGSNSLLSYLYVCESIHPPKHESSVLTKCHHCALKSGWK